MPESSDPEKPIQFQSVAGPESPQANVHRQARILADQERRKQQKIREATLQEAERQAAAQLADAGKPRPAPGDYTIEVEFRGETLWYIEHDRKLSMPWFWTNGYSVYASQMTDWKLAGGGSRPVTDEERAMVIDRVVTYAKQVQGVEMKVY
jgi:hypothetical protein